MEKLTQTQQLSFDFEDTSITHAMVNLSTVPQVVQQDSVAIPAVVYDFRTALSKRKESAHASLYRQILDSVRHIG